MATVLLSSVFGPYGVDDAFGRKENVMELFHNQVTREQGPFSLRFNHPSFGLHLIAENVDADVTVLDFPSQRRFVREIKKGYDYIGISFIVPNFKKAQTMARLVRQHAPKAQLILGGHGTRIPELEALIDCDHICRGEGIRWLRDLLGEEGDRPFSHPAVPSGVQKRIIGVPRPTEAAMLCPGVGCTNGCRFCATTHFFDRRYTPFFATGDKLYAACRDIEEKLGVTEFFVMDENFLKQRERAERLLELMERDNKAYSFGLFSSADTVREVGVDFLTRLGVYFLWMGVESKREAYAKNHGIDFASLIAELRDAGVAVLASGILFLEHHDRETIKEDIDFMASLGADFVQFMELGPLPRTALYDSYRSAGRLREDVPYEEWHGQDKIWFDHPNFTREESAAVIKGAFEREFHANGPSLLRYFETTARGARNIAPRTPMLAQRRQQYLDTSRSFRPMLRVMRRIAPTSRMRAQVRQVEDLYTEVLGPERPQDRIFSWLALPFALREIVNVRLGRNRYQPPTMVTRYTAIEERAPLKARGPREILPPRPLVDEPAG